MENLTESEALRVLREVLGDVPVGPRVTLGIGDDCAVLAGGDEQLIWTMDACLESVHFERSWLSPRGVGEKSFRGAVSDLAAMAAAPLGALSQLTLPAGFSADELRGLVQGQADAARELRCPIVGGNVSAGKTLGVVTTALGTVPDRSVLLTRAGAQPGDELWLIGELGLAHLAFRVLAGEAHDGLNPDDPDPDLAACLDALRRPRVHLERGRQLVGRAHACLDISDGLARDASNLARASGVRVVVDSVALAATTPGPVRSVAERLHLDPAVVMTEGGEDYALLAAGPAERRPEGVHVIGRIEEAGGGSTGAERSDAAPTSGRGGAFLFRAGQLEPLDPGFEHVF